MKTKGRMELKKATRTLVALTCMLVFAFGVTACGSSGGTTSTVTKTVEEQSDNQNQNQKQNQNQNQNESVSKQKKECLKYNKGYPENCANIP